VQLPDISNAAKTNMPFTAFEGLKLEVYSHKNEMILIYMYNTLAFKRLNMLDWSGPGKFKH